MKAQEARKLTEEAHVCLSVKHEAERVRICGLIVDAAKQGTPSLYLGYVDPLIIKRLNVDGYITETGSDRNEPYTLIKW